MYFLYFRVASATKPSTSSSGSYIMKPMMLSKQIHLVSELCLRRIQIRSTRSLQSRLFVAWDAYSAGDLTTSGLLKKVTVVYGHRNRRAGQQYEEDDVQSLFDDDVTMCSVFDKVFIFIALFLYLHAFCILSQNENFTLL